MKSVLRLIRRYIVVILILACAPTTGVLAQVNEEPDTSASEFLKKVAGIQGIQEDTLSPKLLEEFSDEDGDKKADASVLGMTGKSSTGKDTLTLVEKAKEHVKIGGGFGISTAFYHAFGGAAQRDPFYWQFTGNIDLTIGQVSMPFSATLNQQDRSFTQPFNQYGVSPSYKWVTAHVGFRTMQFSEYSLSGNQFLGAGLELMPEKSPIRAKMLFGRFAKAVDGYFTDGMVVGTPSFERWGGGLYLESGKPQNNVAVYTFKARDDRNSLTEFAEDATIRPADNLIVGVSTKQQIKKKILVNGEINFSAYTRDTRVEPTVLEGYTYLDNLGPLFFANATSTFNKAIKGDISYTEKKYKVGLGYRRVDPDYLSMGSVYLNNDFEDVQLQTMFRLLKNKMSVTASGGFQRNNLNKDKSTQMNRLISSASVSYTINQQWSAMGSFSNFNSESQMVVVSALDTMRYAQVTRSANAQVMFNKSTKKVRYGASINGNYQNAKIFQNDTLNMNSSSELFNSNLAFQFGHLKTGFNVSSSLGAAMNVTGDRTISTLGPTVAVNKRWLSAKLTTSFSVSYLMAYLNEERNGVILNLKSNNNYRINRHHALQNTISYIMKQAPNGENKQFIATLGYNYIF